MGTALRRTSVALSLTFHGALFAAMSTRFESGPRFEVNSGSAPVEVSFSESVRSRGRKRFAQNAAEPVVRAADPTPAAAAALTVAASPMSPDTATATETETASTVDAGTGAASAAKANYLRNPAPVYPERARRNGETGVVVLAVEVTARGTVNSLSVKRSSGFESLDAAALRAVRSWIFEPATVGGVAVNTSVDVPIRFNLETS